MKIRVIKIELYMPNIYLQMSHESKAMLIEVTSHASLGACKTVMDKMLQECLLLGIGDEGEASFHALTIQQVFIQY